MLSPTAPSSKVSGDVANRSLFLSELTPAERLVAVHLVQGLSNKEIAALLGKAEPTVKHHVSAILDTAGVESRCRFIAAYYQQFLCSLPLEASATKPCGRSIFAASNHDANCS